jgi:hypothetical protein
VANVFGQIAGGTTPYTVQSVTSQGVGDYVQISGGYILFAPAGNTNSTLNYTVVDSSSPTLTASSTITVTVTNAFSSANSISSTGSSVTITFAGTPGYNYVVERTSDTINGPWTVVTGSATNAPSAGLWTFTDSSPPNPSYYRLRQNN